MYFISDLDKTLIFSGYQEGICVEKYNDRNITFMTQNGFNLLQEVLQNVVFIPCTMRNLHQTLRIDFIFKYNPKYMICTNGCEIYINGKLDKNWENIVRKKILVEEILNLQKQVDNLRLKHLIENRSVSDFFLALKFNTTHLDEELKILRQIIPNTYNIQQDKHKIFLLNKSIDKSNAINYLKENYLIEDKIVVAGDSKADENMTKLSYVKAFIPKHATFKNKKAIQTKQEGILATEEILTNIIKESKIIF